MYCSICGTQNDDSAKFCASCGVPVVSITPTEDQTPPIMPLQMTSLQSVPETTSEAEAYPAATMPLRPYKTEFVLGLIGSILGVAIFLILLIVGVSTIRVTVLTIAASVFALASFILGFAGASKLNTGNGSGGIFLTAAGCAAFAAMFFGVLGWLTVFYHPLLLAAGIIALARRRKAESGTD